MANNDERDKFLSEAMGISAGWQGPGGCLWWGFPLFCGWSGFGALMAFLDGEMSDSELADMLYTLAMDGCIQDLPDRVANYAYDFLKNRA